MSRMQDLETAESLLARWQYGKAADACRAVLAAHPGDLDAEHLLGRILCESGSVELATLTLLRVAMLRPEDPGAWVSLGRAQRIAGEPEVAVTSLERALALDPDHGPAIVEMADARTAQGDLDGAEAVVSAALQRDPGAAELHLALARVLLATGRTADARAAYGDALARDPDVQTRHYHLAARYRAQGRNDEALRELREGLALNPGDPELEHMLMAAGGAEAATRASAVYVAQHFDRFAPWFDERLQDLGYCGPEVIMELLALGEPAAALDVLDAGCGTGLAAPLLRPYARRLVGVDLSGEMLSLAEARGLYDELHRDELVHFFATVRDAFNLIVIADVLIYFGELTELFTAMAGALRPGGRVAVSSELHDGEGIELRATGRWAHSRAELAAAAGAAGLELELSERPLRKERGSQLQGIYGVTPAGAS